MDNVIKIDATTTQILNNKECNENKRESENE